MKTLGFDISHQPLKLHNNFILSTLSRDHIGMWNVTDVAHSSDVFAWTNQANEIKIRPQEMRTAGHVEEAVDGELSIVKSFKVPARTGRDE